MVRRFAAGGDGFEFSVPAMEATDTLVLSSCLQNLMIVSLSARGRSASLSSFETSRESGDFIIESPSRVLPIDRITDELGAVTYGPAHLCLGIEYGQPDSRPVV